MMQVWLALGLTLHDLDFKMFIRCMVRKGYKVIRMSDIWSKCMRA